MHNCDDFLNPKSRDFGDEDDMDEEEVDIEELDDDLI